MAYFDKKWTCKHLMQLHNAPVRLVYPLKMYYLYMLMTLISLTMGASAEHICKFGGGATTIPLILSILALTREVTQHIFVLLVAAFSAGALAYPLPHLFSLGDGRLMVMAFVALAVAPCWFLILAFRTRRRCRLYCWATLLSAITVIISAHATSVVFNITDQNKPEYLSFYLLFLWYMVVYSQQLIFNAGLFGTIDYMRATISFFTDVPAVIARLFYLLCVRTGLLGGKDRNKTKNRRN